MRRAPLARAAVFNAQGFSRAMLSVEQRRRMRAGAVNYVVAGDVIGALLYHPERRAFVRGCPGANAHSPDAFVFNAQGFPIPARRPALSFVVEALSRALVMLERLGVADLSRRLLRCPPST